MGVPFNRLLRQRRIAAGMTQSQLAREIRTNESRMSMLETGVLAPPKNTKEIVKMAEVIGCNPDELCIAAGRFPPDLIDRGVEIIAEWRERNVDV